MMTVQLSNTWCDEHLMDCWQSYNESTGEHTHIEDYTTAKHHLEATGYYYAGHRAGAFKFCLRKSSPLAQPGFDWQMAKTARTEHREQILAELGF